MNTTTPTRILTVSLTQFDARPLLTTLSLRPFASPHKDAIRNNAAVDLKNYPDRHIQQNGDSVSLACFL